MARERIALPDWPTGYGSPARKPVVYFGIPFFSLAAIFFAVRLVGAVAAVDILPALFFAGGMIVSASFVAALVSMWDVRRHTLPSKAAVTDTGAGPAFTLPMSRPLATSMVALLISATIFLAAYAVSLAVDGSSSGATQVRNYLFAIVLIVVVGATAWLSVHYVRLLKGDSRLAFGPEGIELDNGSVHQQLRWSDIEKIEASLNYNNPALIIKPSVRESLRTLSSSVLVRRLNRQYLRDMVIDVHFYRIDPALLYQLVRFYWAHPELRDELASEAVIDRIRRANLRD